MRSLVASPTHSSLPAPRQSVDDTAPWGVQKALAAARDAAPALGLAASDLDAIGVVQVVSTAVLHVGDLAVKVYPRSADLGRLRRTASVLTGHADIWVPPVSEPVVTAHGVVVAYPWHAGDPVAWGEIGDLLSRWHAADVAPGQLQPWAPLGRLPMQLMAYAGTATSDPGLVRIATQARGRLLEQVATLGTALGQGVIHGDVSPSNVLRRNGSPALIDSDFVALGPREYDLVPAAQRLAGGTLSAADYDAFCSSYGYDVRGWDGLPLIEEICRLGAITFRLWCAVQRGDDTAWLAVDLAPYA